jgi:hypothetical protein
MLMMGFITHTRVEKWHMKRNMKKEGKKEVNEMRKEKS